MPVVRHRFRRARDVGRAAVRAAAELGRRVGLALPHRRRQALREGGGVGRVAVAGVAGDDVVEGGGGGGEGGGGGVGEDVGASAVLLDEAEALFRVEPLDGPVAMNSLLRGRRRSPCTDCRGAAFAAEPQELSAEFTGRPTAAYDSSDSRPMERRLRYVSG